MKNNHIVKILFLICLALSFALLNSCDGDDEDKNAAVELLSFGPSPALRGGELRFFGNNLDQITSIVLPEAIAEFAGRLNASDIT